ncbi:MAG: hypothetical protein P1P59_00545 [Treponemataceae bacterium]
MLSGSNQVAKEMHNLTQITEELTATMHQISQSVININNAVSLVNEISKTNQQSIQRLSGEINKFRV